MKKRINANRRMKSLGWISTDSQSLRRSNALASRRGNCLRAAKALMTLSAANGGSYGDKVIARKARSDALYFFRKSKNGGKRK